MNIGLDYDETYAMDPLLWDMFIALCKQRGHNVYIVTARHEYEDIHLHDFDIPVHYTGRLGKHAYMVKQNVMIHIWIDDSPQYIHADHGSLLSWDDNND